MRIVKNWFTNTTTREENWDELANKVSSFANRTNNNLKQIGLDIDGADYDYNNNGVATQTTAIVDRLDALEAANFDIIGIKNIALDISDATKVKVVSADSTSFSSVNAGYVTFNSTSNAGRVVTRQITANVEVTLTGAHWGFGGDGDLTDQPLWLFLIDTGSEVRLGVGARAERTSITTADDETVETSVNAIDKVLVDTALTAENNCIVIGRILANFDDTGNPGGEDYWTIQTGLGEVELGYRAINNDGVFYF